ncbi:Nn.00g072000.m01.CDS01 [Neocucurbitaria sp. VM-36]
MESPVPFRHVSLESDKDTTKSSGLKRKGSTLQTSVEVFRCKFGKPTAIPEGQGSFEPSKEWTPIYYAVYHQREAALSHFLRNGGSPDDVNGTGQPPLCIAVANGHIQIVKILLEAGADVNATTKNDGETALHIAIKNGRSDFIDIILPYGPNLEAQTEETGETPLHYAASKSGSLATVVALLKLGAKYDTLNTKGQTPAEAALQANNLNGAVAIINAAHGKRNKLLKEKEMLLKHVQKTKGRFSIGNDLIADIFSAACDPDSTVLVEAIKRDDAGLVGMFLEKGSDPDRETAKGLRPLFVALECAGAAVIQALVKHNADVSIRDARGFTVLQAAFESPMAQDKEAMSAIFDAFLSKDANAMITYPDGKTLLHRAISARFGHTRVAHLLISSGVKVNAQDNDGNTALHLATHSRSCIEILLKNGANPRQINFDGLTPLLYATTYSKKEKEPDLESLIKASDLRKTNADEQTALHLAAANGLEKTIRLLLRARAETTIVDSNKHTPLLLAVKGHQWAVVPLLTIPPSINSWDEDGMSALHHIARSIPKAPSTWKDIAAAAVPFCDRGVSRSMRDRSGATPLIEAVKTLPGEGLPVIEVLLMQKTDRRASWNCVSHEDHQKHDALFYAITLGKPAFVEALLKHGALFTFAEWTPGKGKLDSSVATERQIMKLLAQYEWARRAGSLRRQSSDSEAETPAFATMFPTKEVKQMISMGLDVNALPKSPLGTSMLWAVLRHIPLQPSMSPKYLFDTIKLILDAGADANIGTARGSRRSPSPSSPQVSRESLPLSLHPLTFLLEESPTVDIDLVTLLLTKGTKLSIASPFYGGRSPLHSAVKANRMDIVDEFLLQRANVNCEDQNGATPLYTAAEKGFWEIVDALLRRGAKVEIQDNEKNTPLHLAAIGGSKRVVATLLRAGAKANVKNVKGLTPLACVPDNLDDKEKDKIVPMLKDSTEKESREEDRLRKQDEQNAAYETKLKQRKDEEIKMRLKREQEEKERLQKEQETRASLRKEQEERQNAETLTKPTLAAPKAPKKSLFKKPSLLSARLKSQPPPVASMPKQTSMVSMRITTPTQQQKPTFTPNPNATPRSVSTPQPPATPQPPTTARSATTDFYNIPVAQPSAPAVPALVTGKPLSAPRIDSGFGQKRPSDTEKPLPPLDRNKSMLGANENAQRVSGHELNDWLALSKMLDNL